MVGRWRMAGGTVGVANYGVIKEGVAEIAGIGVAQRAGAAIMVCRRRVAGGTVGAADGGVVEDGVLEIGGIGVTTTAQTGKMIGRRGVTIRTVGVANGRMIKLGVLPIGNVVAGSAVCAIGAGMGVIGLVAGHTSGSGALIFTSLMTGFAGDVRMAAFEREKAVGDVSPRGEGDGVGIVQVGYGRTTGAARAGLCL